MKPTLRKNGTKMLTLRTEHHLNAEDFALIWILSCHRGWINSEGKRNDVIQTAATKIASGTLQKVVRNYLTEYGNEIPFYQFHDDADIQGTELLEQVKIIFTRRFGF